MSLLIVVLVFAALLATGALLGRQTIKEAQEVASAWVRDVLGPKLRPAVRLPIPGIEGRCVAAALSKVEVTAGGRGALRSPVWVLLSPRDRECIEPVEEFFPGEIRERLSEVAKKRGLVVPAELVVEIGVDPAVRDGQPVAEMGRHLPASVRKMAASYSATAFYPPGAAPGAVRIPEDTAPYADEELVSLDGRPAIHLDPDRPVLTLGQAAYCDIVVEHAGIGRVHAEIQRRGTTLLLVDLGSPTGTTVNGRPVHEVRLINGDEIQLAPRTNGPRYVFSRLGGGEEQRWT